MESPTTSPTESRKFSGALTPYNPLNSHLTFSVPDLYLRHLNLALPDHVPRTTALSDKSNKPPSLAVVTKGNGHIFETP